MPHGRETDAPRSKVVAFAKWQYSYTLTPEQKQEKEEYYSKRAPYPEGTNEVLYKDFFGQLDTLREKYVDEEEEYCESTESHTIAPRILVFGGSRLTSADTSSSPPYPLRFTGLSTTGVGLDAHPRGSGSRRSRSRTNLYRGLAVRARSVQKVWLERGRRNPHRYEASRRSGHRRGNDSYQRARGRNGIDASTCEMVEGPTNMQMAETIHWGSQCVHSEDVIFAQTKLASSHMR